MLPSTDNLSWLSSVNSLSAGPCFTGKKQGTEKSQSIVSFSFFNFQKLDLAEAGVYWTMM